MEKDFDGWNKSKQKIDKRANVPFYHEREVWWCLLGVNVGHEQNGAGRYQRPVLVLKRLSQNTCLIVPLTASIKPNYFRIPLGIVNGQNILITNHANNLCT